MKNRDMQKLWKEAGILFAITLAAGILLGFVHELTEEPIRLQEERAVQEACGSAFPEEGTVFLETDLVPSERLQEELARSEVSIGRIYEAREAGAAAGSGAESSSATASGEGSAGALKGYVAESTSAKGYGGDITLYVGVLPDGTLSGVSILEIDETPGLGMNAEKVLVPQFAGKNAETFTYIKTGSQSDSEIDAISGATKTTRAFVDAVNGALRLVKEELLGGGADE